MLTLVQKVFRSLFGVILWINLIGFVIIGCIAMAQPLGILGGILGIILGGFFGMFTNIVFGGFIATFIEIGEDLKGLRNDLRLNRKEQ